MKWKSPFCNGSDLLCCPVRVGMEKSLRTLSERWTKGRKRRSGHKVIRDRAAHSPLPMHTTWLKWKRLLLLESLVRSAMHQVLKDYHMPLIWWFEFLTSPVNLLIMARMGMSVTSLHLISKISVITLIITAKLQFVLDIQNFLMFMWLSFYFFGENQATVSV